jgi:2-formylbenzoate dehydrogenase
MLVGGQLVEASATYETVNPYTEQPIVAVPAASASDVDRAVQAAKDGFEAWRSVPPLERARRVRVLHEVLLEHEQELSELDALDGGNPVTAMRNDVRSAVMMSELAANWALELKGHTVPATANHLHYTVREPYGVVGRIIPFNHPLLFATRVTVALIAGNSVVLKAPDQTPLSALRFGELIADIFPPGVLNILTGRGVEAGDRLVRHPDVRRIAFTGAPNTGRAIQRAAAESGVKNVSLELGGKNPLIVFPDADVEAAAKGAVLGMNFSWTAGQSCGSTSRLLVHHSIADEVIDAVREQAERLRIGDPLDPETEMGTLVSEAQMHKVLRYVQEGRMAGASLVTGGGRPDYLDRGYIIAPTLFADVTPEMSIAQEEIFGPVLSVLTWRDEREALQIANGTAYGLTASVFTSDIQKAHAVARQLDCGYVWINTSSAHYPGMPFGGFKDSGVGREEDIGELLSYTQLKSIHLPVGPNA